MTELCKGIQLLPGDMREVLQSLEPGSVDSCVCDPPYHLHSIVMRFGPDDSKPALSQMQRRFAKSGGADRKPGPDQYGRLSRGFMGQKWDGGEIAFEPETWAAVYRVLKPGGHLLAFGAPKNFGFMQVAIANAGFEIRDVLAWMFGSGFPKSHNVGDGWGTALKPAYEPIIKARKPLIGTVAQNLAEHGTGAINIDATRVESGDNPAKWETPRGGILATDSNATAALTVSDKGRWPANVVHDGSEEVLAAFPDAPGQQYATGPQYDRNANVYGKFAGVTPADPRGDSGSAARFFYTAKADQDDRLGSKHPTVKPVDLMQWLVRMVTPKGGLVLDPFAGTGTTGEAAFREGMRAVLIEREPEYQDDIRRRMQLVLSGPEERRRETIKHKTKGAPADHGPLWEAMWAKPLTETNPEYNETD